MVWGFADITISTNLARDLGTRLVALIFYGREAFTYMGYAPIAILVNVPATLFATAYCKQRALDSFYPLVLFLCENPEDSCLGTRINSLPQALWLSIYTKANITYESDEFLLRDSFLTIGKGHAQHRDGDEGLMRHISKTGVLKEDDLRQVTSNGDAKTTRFEHMEK